VIFDVVIHKIRGGRRFYWDTVYMSMKSVSILVG